MLMKLNMKKASQRVAAAALLCGLTFSAATIPQVAAQPDAAALETVRFTNSAALATPEAGEVQNAVQNFIRGMTEGDVKTVWMYASEEEQMAFETEEATYAAFVDAFPVLTEVKEVAFDSYRNEGDTPFVEVSLKDAKGNPYRATMGLWLDDAGDWKIISCDVKSTTDRVASL